MKPHTCSAPAPAHTHTLHTMRECHTCACADQIAQASNTAKHKKRNANNTPKETRCDATEQRTTQHQTPPPIPRVCPCVCVRVIGLPGRRGARSTYRRPSPHLTDFVSRSRVPHIIREINVLRDATTNKFQIQKSRRTRKYFARTPLSHRSRRFAAQS